ncbi:ankyrin repeat-containing domain protein [Morchella snyderi]|nr:ankyrin repeat-containing domain protein [Morchella snyderi]
MGQGDLSSMKVCTINATNPINTQVTHGEGIKGSYYTARLMAGTSEGIDQGTGRYQCGRGSSGKAVLEGEFSNQLCIGFGSLSRNIGAQRAGRFSIGIMILLLACNAHALCNTPDCAPAEGWDNFANNLGSDMAPLLALFGEQVTKQYLNESLDWMDNLLFAIAPLGIITAMVASIRVAGSSRLKSLIGRAKETPGEVEADLMSSTSTDVCELWSGKGVVRVIGAPFLLQLVWVPDEVGQPGDLCAGLYNFREQHIKEKYYKPPSRGIANFFSTTDASQASSGSTARDEYTQKMHNELRRVPANLLLNISVKPLRRGVLLLFILAAIIAQGGVLVFAAVSQYILHLPKNNSTVPAYAFPVLLAGTIALAVGVFLCARAIETSTTELTWQPKRPGPEISILWLQKGGQNVGDQQFGAFAHKSIGTVYTSHRKGDGFQRRETLVMIAITISLLGFIAQFFALRAAHSSVTVTQLVAILFVTGLRCFDHLPRDNENRVENPEHVEGFELDWLAKDLGHCTSWEVISSPGRHTENTPTHPPPPPPPPPHDSAPPSHNSDRTSPQASIVPPGSYPIPSTQSAGTERITSLGDGSKPQAEKSIDDGMSRARGVMKARARLASLSEDWNLEVRKTVGMLQKAIEMTMNDVFLRMTMKEAIRGDSSLKEFTISIPVKTVYKNAEENYKERVVLLLRRESNENTRGGGWNVDPAELEAVLCLWISSLEEKDRSRDDDQPVLKNVWLTGRATDIAKLEYGIWIYRETACKITPLREDERYFGWASEESTPASDSQSYISVEMTSTLQNLCARQIYLIFLRQLACQIESVGGETTRLLGGTAEVVSQIEQENRSNDRAEFALKNTNLSSLATIFYDCGMGTIQEAYFCIIPAFEIVERPQCPLDAFMLANQTSAKLAVAGEWGKAAEVDQWLLSVFKAMHMPQIDLNKFYAAIVPRLRESALLLASTINDGSWSQRLLEREKMWNAIYSQCKMLSEGIPSSQLSLILVILCLTRLRIKQDNDHNELRQLLWSTLLSLDPKVLEGDMKARVENEDMSVFQHADLLTRYLWANSMEGSSSTPIEEQLLPSRTLIHARCLTGDMFSSTESQDYMRNPSSGLNVATAVSRLAPSENEDNRRIPIDLLLIRGHRTPLQMAAEIGNTQMVEQLLKLNSLSSTDDRPAPRGGRTSLQAASAKGHLDIMNLLLKNGASANEEPAPYDGRTALQAAAEAGNREAADILLKSGALVNAQPAQERGLTALQGAASGGYVLIVKWLLEDLRADINAEISPNGGRTALQGAAEGGHMEVVKFLLVRGANVEALPAPYYGRTALQAASGKGHEQIVHLLLENGAEVNSEPAMYYGRTALQAASESGHISIVKSLLSKGANANAPAALFGGCTAIQGAAGAGEEEIVRYFLEMRVGLDIRPPSTEGKTALHAAIEGGHQKIVEILTPQYAIEFQPSKECIALVRNRILQSAFESSNAAIKKLILKAFSSGLPPTIHLAIQTKNASLLHHLANTDEIDFSGAVTNAPVLAEAVLEGYTEVVKWILKHKKGNINFITSRGTALLIAVMESHKEIIEILLGEKDILVNKGSSTGFTPLMAATRHGSKEIFDLLLKQAGADYELLDFSGMSCLSYAIQHGNEYAFKTLMGLDFINRVVDTPTTPKRYTPLMLMCSQPSYSGGSPCFRKQVFNLLLKRPDVDINKVGDDGATPLLLAVQHRYMAILEELLRIPELDMTICTASGYSALHVAVAQKRSDVIRLLLGDFRSAVLLNKQEHEGKTAIWIASLLGHIDCTKELLSNINIDINISDHNNQTPLFIAAEHGHTEIVKLLLGVKGIKVNCASTSGKTALSATLVSEIRGLLERYVSDASLDA